MEDRHAAPGVRYGTLLLLLRTADHLWNESQKFFAPWELSPSQFNVLNLLRTKTDGCTQIELSRALIMHRSNVTGLADRLEKRGLIRRTATAGDRRAYNLSLTPAGRKLIEEILPGYHRACEDVWGAIPLSRIEKMRGDLEALIRNVEQISAQQIDSFDETGR